MERILIVDGKRELRAAASHLLSRTPVRIPFPVMSELLQAKERGGKFSLACIVFADGPEDYFFLAKVAELPGETQKVPPAAGSTPEEALTNLSRYLRMRGEKGYTF